MIIYWDLRYVQVIYLMPHAIIERSIMSCSTLYEIKICGDMIQLKVRNCKMKLRGSFFLWLVLNIELCHPLQFIPSYFNYSIFEDTAIALYKNAKFMASRIEQLNVDAAFGLTLAQANLAAVLSSPRAKFISGNQWNRIITTQKLCNDTRVHTDNKLTQNKNNPDNKLIQVLTTPEIWIGKIQWRMGAIHSTSSKISDIISINANDLIFFGTPQSIESDYCLMQLIEDDCKVSDICANMLIRNDKSRGYPLTHRLLYVKIASAINCHKNPRVNFTIIIKNYCERIFQDLIDIEIANFPSVSRDLAMEQITLCGMEGYLDFINGHYANLITNWQNSCGCYSALKINQPKHEARSKKSTNQMDCECDSHASGLAAVTLSLFIRGYIDNF